MAFPCLTSRRTWRRLAGNQWTCRRVGILGPALTRVWGRQSASTRGQGLATSLLVLVAGASFVNIRRDHRRIRQAVQSVPYSRQRWGNPSCSQSSQRTSLWPPSRIPRPFVVSPPLGATALWLRNRASELPLFHARARCRACSCHRSSIQITFRTVLLRQLAEMDRLPLGGRRALWRADRDRPDQTL